MTDTNPASPRPNAASAAPATPEVAGIGTAANLSEYARN